MEIRLKGVVPNPLKDKLANHASNVWNTNLSFSSPAWVKIIAPSGTGKTTLMNTLYKLRQDYSGLLQINNADLKTIEGDELALLRQQKINVIFQDLRLFENLTARENIELNRVLQKPYYEAEMINTMADRLGIIHILSQRAGVCSYGEQQRIAIIRALMQPFELLLMDEPFSHLDIANTSKAAALIGEECRKRNAGFVFTDLEADTLFQYDSTYHL